MENGGLHFGRGNEIPSIPERVSRRELFSICGKLIGHYPVCGWLRVACSYLKRMAEGVHWKDYVGERVESVLSDMLREVAASDPVTGSWKVDRTEKGKVWCDASSLALGVAVEVDNIIVEDAAWLRKKNDYNHINVAELEATLKGVNLAIKWGLTDVELVTDSATVYRWIQMTLTEEKKIKSKGAAEIVVKRRLGVLKTLVEECGLNLNVSLVPSHINKADVLTRVRRRWLIEESDMGNCAAAACIDEEGITPTLKESHEAHHLGVERSLFLARKVIPNVSKEEVKAVVQNCERCQRIDPAPANHVPGELSVGESWKRLAIDVTHYKNRLFLTLVDCGPGRFVIWREMHNETSTVIIKNLHQIFCERGPVDELLMDNATAFRSQSMSEFLSKWGVRPCFRAAYRPSGNGIVERCHRTIKTMAERARISPVEAVYWYNMSPRCGQDESSVPQSSVHTYKWCQPYEMRSPRQGEDQGLVSKIQIGDEVWVKPPRVKCTSEWPKGTITGINSSNNIEVDGVPRHILDLRLVVPTTNEPENEEESYEVENRELSADSESDEFLDSMQDPDSPEVSRTAPGGGIPRALARLQSYNKPGRSEETRLCRRYNRGQSDQ